jgi:TRAP-type uncharacterized transport system fused permease subunit
MGLKLSLIGMCAAWLIFPVVYFIVGPLEIGNTSIFSLAAFVISLSTITPSFVRTTTEPIKRLPAFIIGLVSVVVIMLYGGFPSAPVVWLGLLLVTLIFILSSYEFSASTSICGVLLLICFYAFGEGQAFQLGKADVLAGQIDAILFTNLGLFGAELSKGIVYVISFSTFVFLLNILGFPYYVADAWSQFIARFSVARPSQALSKLMIVQHCSSTAPQAVAIMEDIEPNGVPTSGENAKPKSVAIPAVIAAQAPIGFPLFGAAIFFLIDQLGVSFREIFFGLIPLSILVSLTTLVVCAGFRSVRSVVVVSFGYTVISVIVYYLSKLILNNNISVSVAGAFLVCAAIVLVFTIACRTKVSSFKIVDTGVANLLGLPPTNKRLFFIKGPQQLIPILLFVFLISVDISPIDALIVSSFLAVFSVLSFLACAQTDRGRSQFLSDAIKGYGVILLEFGRYLSRNILAIAFTGVLLGVFFSTGFPKFFLSFYTNFFGFNVIALLLVSGVVCLLLGGPLPAIPAYLLTSYIFLPVLIVGFFDQGVVPNALGFCFFLLCFASFSSLTPPDSLCLDLCKKWIAPGAVLPERSIWIEIIWFSLPALFVAFSVPFAHELNLNTAFGLGGFIFTGITMFLGIVFIMLGLRWIRERQSRFPVSATLLVVFGIFLFLPIDFSNGIWRSVKHYPGTQFFKIIDDTEFRPHVTLVFSNGKNDSSQDGVKIGLPIGKTGAQRLQSLGLNVRSSKAGVPVVVRAQKAIARGADRVGPGSILSRFYVTNNKGHYGFTALLFALLGFALMRLENRETV